MAVPTVMADLSTTAASNSPAGSESPISTDDFHRAIQSILRHTNAKGADIASATTTDIGAATGEFVDVTGTTTITGLGTIAAGIERTVRFTGALTLTHNGTTLILPGAANITTAANDRALFRSLGSGNWLCISYVRADGNSVISSLPLTGGTLTGDVTMSAATIKWAKGADVASASALPLITDGNYFDVTGTVTVTSLNSVGVGTVVKLHFDGAVLLTHHSTDLILPGGANITTAAGDELEFVEYASGDWRCTNYVRADGAGRGWTYLAEQASTSGTTINFTGIASWATEVEVMGVAVSTNGTSDWIAQIGDAGGIENTSYVSNNTSFQTAPVIAITQYTAGFGIMSASVAASTSTFNVRLSLENATNNTWVIDGSAQRDGSAITFIATGYKALSATLDRLTITTGSGVNTFDAGVIRVRYR
jgi:hypothetical protein